MLVFYSEMLYTETLHEVMQYEIFVYHCCSWNLATTLSTDSNTMLCATLSLPLLPDNNTILYATRSLPLYRVAAPYCVDGGCMCMVGEGR